MLLARGRSGGVYNVGTGVETSVVDLYGAIRAASGVERDAAFAPARLGELQRSVLDPSLAASELGWRPEHSLADGLAATWEWIAVVEGSAAAPAKRFGPWIVRSTSPNPSRGGRRRSSPPPSRRSSSSG